MAQWDEIAASTIRNVEEDTNWADDKPIDLSEEVTHEYRHTPTNRMLMHRHMHMNGERQLQF